MSFVNGEQFRLQIYDDGSGEYIFDEMVNDTLVGGSSDAVLGNAGNAVGPYILPTPLAITKPGLVTVQLANVNTPLNSPDEANTTQAYVALVFAVPKKCKGQNPSGAGVRPGVLN